MANEQNLKPVKSKKEAREKGRNGGIESGKARRQTKLFQGLLEDFLKNPEKDESKIAEAIDNANLIGVKKEEITNAVIMTAKVLAKAKDGDLKAFELVRDGIGEKPADTIGYKEIETDKEDEEIMKRAAMKKWGLVENTNK